MNPGVSPPERIPMPRDIPVGNGSLLVCFDFEYQLRDLYFPYVGKENHACCHAFRLGFWVEGRFSWMGPEWNKEIRYLNETQVSEVHAEHAGLSLRLSCNDLVDFHEDIYIKKMTVENQSDREREVRIFFSEDAHLYGTEVGDTVFYDPETETLIHYKDLRYLSFGAWVGSGVRLDQFSTGIKEFQGADGTWKDAEDGILEGNPIAQGSVDSTLGVNLKIPASGSRTLYFWISAGTKYHEILHLTSVIRDKGPEKLLRRTRAYWHRWVNKREIEFPGLSPEVIDLFKKSLLIIRTQIDRGGAVIAANDSDIRKFGRDTYSYMWPRDGALVVYALDRMEYINLSENFFSFCAKILKEEGYFLHKYNPNGSLASSWHPWQRDDMTTLPIQEDETALVLWALDYHYNRYRNLEFIKPFYRSLIIRSADFMDYYRDPETGLPRPSYDLWEERIGIHAFTCAAVYAGLRSAANFADLFGEKEDRDRYLMACSELRSAVEEFFYDPASGRFARMLINEGGALKRDMTLDASLFGLTRFGMFDPGDPRMVRTMKDSTEALSVRTEIGGMARYERDYYHRVSDDYDQIPGNPWFICSLWTAQYRIAGAETLEDLTNVRPILQWVQRHARPSGVIGEQMNPLTGSYLSVSPLTWSHAEYVITISDYLEKFHALSGRK